MASDRAYIEHDPGVVPLVESAGARTIIGVPMLKDNEVVGAIAVFRQEVRPFTDKQIELVQNFAAQAVIAIENTRLLNELRQRTGDLTESLEQQTATSEVLGIISSSPGELEPVFQAILANALRGRRPSAAENPSAATRMDGGKTHFAVPMLKDNQLIGAIIIYRPEIRLFSDKHTELVQNFAAQAVIAIENMRLLNELRERTEQLQAQSQEVIKLNRELEGRVTE